MSQSFTVGVKSRAYLQGDSGYYQKSANGDLKQLKDTYKHLQNAFSKILVLKNIARKATRKRKI